MTDPVAEPEPPAPAANPTKPETPPEKPGPEKPGPEKPGTEPPAKTRARWPWLLLALVLLFLAGAGTGLYFLPELRDRAPFLVSWIPEPERDTVNLAPLEANMGALERSLARLEADATRRDERIARLENEDTRLATALARVEALAQSFDDIQQTQAVAEPEPKPEPAPAGAPEPVTENAREDAATAEARNQLAARLDMLMLRVGQLESAFVPLSEKVGRQDGAEADRAALERKTGALDADLEALARRLSRLEASASADAKQALRVLTYGAIRRAGEAGRAFRDEYAALEDLGGADARTGIGQALQALEPFAHAPTPTLSELSARLPARINTILEAARTPADASWWQTLWARIRGLVTVRPTGDVAGDGLAAVLARAETRLGFGDLDAAVAELATLIGPAAEAARPWLEDARRRLALNTALEAFEDALRNMALEGPEPASPEATTTDNPDTLRGGA